jgi:hypothetical protein
VATDLGPARQRCCRRADWLHGRQDSIARGHDNVIPRSAAPDFGRMQACMLGGCSSEISRFSTDFRVVPSACGSGQVWVAYPLMGARRGCDLENNATRRDTLKICEHIGGPHHCWPVLNVSRLCGGDEPSFCVHHCNLANDSESAGQSDPYQGQIQAKCMTSMTDLTAARSTGSGRRTHAKPLPTHPLLAAARCGRCTDASLQPPYDREQPGWIAGAARVHVAGLCCSAPHSDSAAQPAAVHSC